jgi:hypothetical protein
MAHAKLNNSAADPFEEESEMTGQALFPDVFDISDLVIDEGLPLLKILSAGKAGSKLKSLKIKIPSGLRNTDIFLLVNNVKKDMFYQIPQGIYEFREIILEKGENVIELFYRQGERRSLSSYFVIKRN